MSEPNEMSTPVTRGELRGELSELRTEFRDELASLEQRIEHKIDLWGGALSAKIDTTIAASEQRMVVQIATAIGGSEQRMSADLARHTNVILEAVRGEVRAIDDKYADLPARVGALEAAVFPPAPARKPARRRRSG